MEKFLYVVCYMYILPDMYMAQIVMIGQKFFFCRICYLSTMYGLRVLFFYSIDSIYSFQYFIKDIFQFLRELNRLYERFLVRIIHRYLKTNIQKI